MSVGGWVAGVAVVVVVGAGLYVTDRVALSRAEDRVAAGIEANFDGVQGQPQVDLGGFPFLPQLLNDRIEDVTASVDGVTIGGVAATDVQVAAQGVSTDEPYTVEHGDVAATLPPESVEQVIADRTNLDVDVVVEGGQLRLEGKVLGVTLSAALELRVEDGKLLATARDFTLGPATISVDDLPGGIGDRLTDVEVPVDGLPQGVVLTGATVIPAGVRITAAGNDLTLPATVD